MIVAIGNRWSLTDWIAFLSNKGDPPFATITGSTTENTFLYFANVVPTSLAISALATIPTLTELTHISRKIALI